VASHFQNRLVGISILVAIVVIFLPSIIDGKKMAYEDEFVSTPLHPKAKVHSQQLLIQQTKSEDVSGEAPASAGQDVIEDDQWQIEEVPQVLTIADQVSPATTTETQPEEAVIAKKAVQKPVEKKALPEHAWTIQLGAFKNLDNINSLLKTLHKAGFQAHTIPREVIDGELTRLFVGPDISKEKLKKQLPRLKRLTKLEGKLMPFDAVTP